MPTGMKYPVHTAEVLHLRSTSHMLGYHVWATDGDFGILEGFVMDEASWHLGYLDVKSETGFKIDRYSSQPVGCSPYPGLISLSNCTTRWHEHKTVWRIGN